ncbi:NAD/NADP octopine/nopaline dehydrogenase family protein [Desulfovibrio sp. OttesenSCG-928-O18]|nr:NAD/NADP octopine/nopaline dehydrogenase family protein [Desulfovibrio sp. OttesenSCG-928-O18]
MKMAIIGAGNTGQIMAFDLVKKGAEVRLYSRDREKAAHIARYGLEAEGRLEGKAAPALVTATMREAVQGAKVICVMTTAGGHRPVAEAMRPYVEEGQIVIVFNANWGALEFHQVFGEAPGTPRVLVGETGTQLYIGSATREGKVFVKQIKENVSLAMIDKDETDAVIAALRPFFPQFTKAANILETSLSSANAIVHTPVCLFNLSRIELGHDFLFYSEGASRSTVAYVEKIDRERMAVMAALGLEARTMLEVINSFWPDKKNTLYDAIQENPSYRQVKGPQALDHRFLTEDLPYGIVPLVHLGRELGVPTPCMEGMLETFARFCGRDYVETGFRPNAAELAAIRG